MNKEKFRFMKPSLLFIGALCFISLFSCKKDDDKSCTTCQSELTPSFELCRESNGNASVNGQDTGTDYDLYVDDLRADGTSCGGG
jgi:hypothetical protein